MGKYYPNINPGEIVPGGFTYPNNAKLQGDFLYLRDANKNMVSGRQVDDGDSITVLDVGYSQQLALVQYPTSAGVRQGYVNNTPSVIKYNNANAWANGSTTEIVYDENGGQLGSLDPYEKATPLYKKDGMTHVVYNTSKGSNTKSGYVKYGGTGGGSTSSGGEIKPGELVPGGFTYPNNAKLQGDFLYLRDANKNMVSGRQVDNGDSITVLDVGYTKQLALVQYPTSAGVRQGYVNNTPSVIKYNDANAWANGSTTEIVYDENGGQLGSLSPYESATPLYKKNGMTHVVYNTDKGPNTKSGYVKYEGGSGFTDSNIKIPPISHPQAIKEEYGISGKERPLNVYKIGNGSKVLFAGFALHGWEDNWDNDGLALVDIANSLITRLGDYKSQNNGLHGWTVYIAPCMNPDGVIVRGTKDGPGRCAVTSRIDMNRCFPYNFTPQYSSRNYTGANSLGAPEAKAIKSYLEKINSSSTEMIVLDFHGWMNFTQGNAEIGRYFGSQFGFGHNNGYSSGFFSSWASTLKNTKAVLIEYPTSTHSYSDVITGNYIGKTFNGIVNILKNNPGASDSGSTGSEETPMAKSGKVINVTSNLNVRSDASISASIIGSLESDSNVTVVAKKDEWYKVKYGSKYGYVHQDYIYFIDKDTTIISLETWQEDCLRRGWGPMTREAYFEEINKLISNDMKGYIINQLNEMKYDIKKPLKLITSDNISLLGIFLNEETEKEVIYQFNKSRLLYDTTKPGFIREYIKKENGSIILNKEIKMPEAKFHPIKARLKYTSSKELKLKFFQGLNKSLQVAGVASSVIEDIKSISEVDSKSNKELVAPICAIIIKNGAVEVFCVTLSGLATTILAPYIPVANAIIGGVLGYLGSYAINAVISELELQELLTDILTWLFDSIDSWFD